MNIVAKRLGVIGIILLAFGQKPAEAWDLWGWCGEVCQQAWESYRSQDPPDASEAYRSKVRAVLACHAAGMAERAAGEEEAALRSFHEAATHLDDAFAFIRQTPLEPYRREELHYLGAMIAIRSGHRQRAKAHFGFLETGSDWLDQASLHHLQGLSLLSHLKKPANLGKGELGPLGARTCDHFEQALAWNGRLFVVEYANHRVDTWLVLGRLYLCDPSANGRKASLICARAIECFSQAREALANGDCDCANRESLLQYCEQMLSRLRA